MANPRVELGVGAFLLLGIAAVSGLAIQLGEFDVFDRGRYPLVARFTSASGLKNGAHVEVGGVRVGKVTAITLDPVSYEARVELALDRAVTLQRDAIASIRTAGIVGDKFVNIAPGGATELLAAGGEILETEASVNLEELLAKYIFASDRH